MSAMIMEAEVEVGTLTVNATDLALAITRKDPEKCNLALEHIYKQVERQARAKAMQLFEKFDISGDNDENQG